MVDKASPHAVKRDYDIVFFGLLPSQQARSDPANLILAKWMHPLNRFPLFTCRILCNTRPLACVYCAPVSSASESLHAAATEITRSNPQDFLWTCFFVKQLEVLLPIKLAEPLSSGENTDRKLSCANNTASLCRGTKYFFLFNHASLHLSIF